MQKLIIFGAIFVAIAGSWLFYTGHVSGQPAPVVTKEQPIECNGDGYVCPDGSMVGRTGADCRFAACPASNATSSTLTTYMGGKATGFNVTVEVRELVSDSRCPQGVACVWAGTVEVRAVLSIAVAHGEHVLSLNKPQVFGDYTVTLVGVTPQKAQEETPVSSYRFTFIVAKT